MVTKGDHKNSLSVLSYAAKHNITGVRGNHDQKVIEWRSFLGSIVNHLDGQHWLVEMEKEWTKAKTLGTDLEVWIEEEKKKLHSKWWDVIPKGLNIFDEHFKIAQDMSLAEYEYLLSLPLILYLPALHAYVVHAGLLSSDPTLPSYDKRQPLAHAPLLPSSRLSDPIFIASRWRLMRRLQEEALLRQVAQNGDPWVTLNMRGIKKDSTVTRYLSRIACSVVCLLIRAQRTGGHSLARAVEF